MSESLDALVSEVASLIDLAEETLSPDEMETFVEETKQKLSRIEENSRYPSER